MQYVTPGDMPLKQRPVAEQGRLFHESSIMTKEEKKKKKTDYTTAGSSAAQYQVIKIN